MSAAITSISAVGDTQLIRYGWARVIGTGFIPNWPVAIFMADESARLPGALCHGSADPADANGTIDTTFQIPNLGTPGGTYTVTVLSSQLVASFPMADPTTEATLTVTVI